MAAPTDSPLARVASLTKQYPVATALDAVTLDLPQGVFGLVGPSPELAEHHSDLVGVPEPAR